MSSAGIRRTGQGGEQRGKAGERGWWWGGQVPEFWPQPTAAASQRTGGRQLGRQVRGRGEEEGTEA